MKLSAAIVTLNEAKNIARCLRSLDFIPDITVVDTGSKDKTIAIARRYTKKIFSKEFNGFSAIKSFAVSKAVHDWVLVIDADEEVTPALKAEIIEIMRNSKHGVFSSGFRSPVSGLPSGSRFPVPEFQVPSPEVNGYCIRRVNYFLGKPIRFCGWGNDYQLRLFKKSKGAFDGKTVHEAVKVKGKTKKLQYLLDHFSYPDRKSYFAKMEKYTTLQAEEGAAAGKKLLFVKMLLAPVFKFLRMYFLKLGFLDGAGGFTLCCYSAYSEFIKFKKMKGIASSQRAGVVAIRAPNWLGDSVISTAFLGQVRARYKKVIVLADKAGASVFRGNRDIDVLIMFDRKDPGSTLAAIRELRKLNPGSALSLTPSLSSCLIFWLAGIRNRVGYANDLGSIFLNKSYKKDTTHRREHVIEEYKKLFHLLRPDFDFKSIKQHIEVNLERERAVLKKFRIPNSKFRILIAPFAKFGPAKEWPIENYEALIKKMLVNSKKTRVYVTGSPQEKAHKFPAEIVKSGRFSDLRGAPLEDIFCVIKNMDLFAGNDSGLMHVADAFEVPVIVIFGATSPSWAGPVAAKAAIFNAALGCQPCFDKTCRYGHYNCLKAITPDKVFAKVKTMM